MRRRAAVANDLANAAMLVYIEGDGQYTCNHSAKASSSPSPATAHDAPSQPPELVELLLTEAINAADGRRRIPSGGRTDHA